MVNELKRRVDVPESSHASKLARSDDLDERRWGLEPEHTIFLSHSGKQKNFTEKLCEELKRAHHFPFFDKCPDSLPKGHDFPSRIIRAARQCHVAILVLSEDFFKRSKWPMIELIEFVKAQASTNPDLKLLPLFYKISVEEFKDAERREGWQKIWQGWAEEDIGRNATHKLDVGAWISALSVVGKINGIAYDKNVGKVAYVTEVVEAVRKLKLPCVKYDVSHVQSLRRLCEAIFVKFHDSENEHLDYKVPQVVGLFGMGGVGKTTITKAMCNGHFGDFVGDFCHVELGVKDVGVLRKQVLQDLTGEAIVPNDLDKLKTLLKKCMQHRKVFLCLDNVWHEDIDEAKMYLQLKYKDGSKVLVTSRSLEVLQSLGLKDCHCMEMPELDIYDSTKLFLHYVGLVSTNNIKEQEWDVINQCVEACYFTKRSVLGLRNDSSKEQYLPLALKVWGTQLGQISRCPLEWRTSLENMSTHKFNHFNVKTHPLFSLLRQGYDSLDERDQLIFLDLAIFVVGATKHYRLELDTMKWLHHAHCSLKAFQIKQSLEALKRKALLEFTLIDSTLEFRIHDLYLDFAREEVQALESSGQTSHILYDFGGVCLPPKLQREQKCQDLKRIGIYESEVKSIKSNDLVHCSQVEVFQIYGCKNLEELDVKGMNGLRILDVAGCEKLGEKFRGVNKLKNLQCLQLHIVKPVLFLEDLLSLTTLQFLQLDGDSECLFRGLDPSGCTNLRELIMVDCESLPNLSKLTMLEKVECHFTSMQSVIGLHSLANLKVLDLSDCWSLVELSGLSNLDALETLNVSRTELLELHGIGKLRHLQVLDVSYCDSLTSLVELEFVTSLCRLEAQYCNSLEELPNLSNLKKLEVVDLRESAISVIPSGFGRLAKNRVFKLVGCVELLEPLVLWLREQELLPLEGLNDEILLEFPHVEEIEDEFQSNIRKDVAYYMDQVSLIPYDHNFELESSLDSLNEMEGGIDYAIKAMCEHEDLGILSLVVAKYAIKLVFEEAILPKLSSRIIDFLYQQLNPSSSDNGFISPVGSITFRRIMYILLHVMENYMLEDYLISDDIHLFIKKFANHIFGTPELHEFEKCDFFKSRQWLYWSHRKWFSIIVKNVSDLMIRTIQ